MCRDSLSARGNEASSMGADRLYKCCGTYHAAGDEEILQIGGHVERRSIRKIFRIKAALRNDLKRTLLNI